MANFWLSLKDFICKIKTRKFHTLQKRVLYVSQKNSGDISKNTSGINRCFSFQKMEIMKNFGWSVEKVYYIIISNIK